MLGIKPADIRPMRKTTEDSLTRVLFKQVLIKQRY